MFQRIGDQAFKKDLTNTLRLLESLGNPHKSLKCIHLAGTNGKGSLTHILASVLQESGLKVACYTSPHYKDFRERIKINGQLVSEDYVIDFVSRIQDMIEEIQPSFFEITVAMAFDYFAKEKVDIAVIETGMGGRFDSTNVITPLLSIITNISYDHQQFLGDTLPLIAFEKAGIIKEDVPVIIGEYQQEIEEVFTNKAMQMNSSLFYAHELFEIADYTSSFEGSSFTTFFGKRKIFYSTDLAGSFQKKNLQTAMAALVLLKEEFNLTDEIIRKGLENIRSNTYFLGRCMKLQDNPLVIVDSAHNEAGIHELKAIIASISYKTLHFVYGTVVDKNLSKLIPLLPSDARYYFCKADIPRGMNAQKLSADLQSLGLVGQHYSSVQEAYQSALKAASKEDLVIVSGSIFVVAEVI
jgi:dihydrofolate synthase / folylpolyglutamate synthase